MAWGYPVGCAARAKAMRCNVGVRVRRCDAGPSMDWGCGMACPEYIVPGSQMAPDDGHDGTGECNNGDLALDLCPLTSYLGAAGSFTAYDDHRVLRTILRISAFTLKIKIKGTFTLLLDWRFLFLMSLPRDICVMV